MSVFAGSVHHACGGLLGAGACRPRPTYGASNETQRSGFAGEMRNGGLREFRRRRPRRGWSLGTAAWHRPGVRRETALQTRTRRKKLPIPRRNRELLADKQLRRQPQCSRRESQPRESREPQRPHRSRWSGRRSSPAPGRTRRGSAGRWGSGCPSGRRS